MKIECEMLGALLSERRRGELSAEEARALESHLDGCARCRAEVEALESVLAVAELPPVTPAELEALQARRIHLARPPRRGSRGWQVPAVLVAAAAAAILTVSIRPVPHRRVETTAVLGPGTAELMPTGNTQELFPDLSSDVSDEGANSVEDDALSLEGAGLFGNLDG